MRILSTGDWHFNASYDEDVLASVNQIIDCARMMNIDLVVITGDVYERASDPGSRNLAAECIQAIANLSPVIVVRGNHDAPGDLTILSKISASYVINVDEEPRVHLFQSAADKKPVAIHTMPWLTKARWQAVHPGTTKEEGDKTVSQLALEFMRNNVALYREYHNILAGHLTIAGARAQNHQQMGADGVAIGIYDMREVGFDAAMLGHIHLMQTLAYPDEFYNGSVAALDYGETPEKYFSVYDTSTGKVEWVKLNTIHRQDIVARWSPEGVVIDEVDPSLLIGARVRAKLRLESGDNIDAAKKQLEEYLKKAQVLEYQINPQVVATAKVRAVEITKAQSLSEKLKQYWNATEAPDEATQKDMLDKLAELEDQCSL